MALSLEELATHYMEMIGYTGERGSLVYETVELMVAGECQMALKKIEEAEDHLSKAREIQLLKLMNVQVGGGEIPCNIFLPRAMDILTTSTTKKDMIKTIMKARIRKGEGVKE